MDIGIADAQKDTVFEMFTSAKKMAQMVSSHLD